MCIEPFVPFTLERDWGTETIVAKTDIYMGKILSMRAGTAGGLQYHRCHDETFHLVSGLAWVDSEGPEAGRLRRIMMGPGESVHVPCGAVHRVTAVEACVFFETGTPPLNDRVRVEEAFGEPTVTGLPTMTTT